MKIARIVLPALAFLVGSVAVAAAADARVEAFRDLCAAHPKDDAATAAAATAAGWTAIGASGSQSLQKLLDAMIDPDETTEKFQSFHKTLPTGEAFLVVTLLDDGTDGYWASCGIYDFNATAIFGTDDVAAWLGGPGKRFEDDDPTDAALYWEGPQKLDEPWTISIRYNPAGSEMVDSDGFAGVAITSSIMPPDDSDDGDDDDSDDGTDQ